MRLIDADAVVKMLEVFISNTDDCVAYKDYNFAYRRCKRLIQDESTSYDIGRVVEELETRKNKLVSEGSSLSAHQLVMAIKIVKAGGTVYNQAIDDFVELMNKMPTYENEYGEIMPMPIEMMAEKLKEGVK